MIKAVVAILICLAVALVAWMLTYPYPDDPKNLPYVLWKHGLYKMDLDIATGDMVGDAHRDVLVIGKTEDELRARFGYLLTPQNASEYLRSCYQNSGWSQKKVLFVRQSAWMVIFDANKATTLVLVKGC